MRNSAVSTLFFGAVVATLSFVSLNIIRESRWNRMVMASFVTKFDDLEFMSPDEKDLLATVTISQLGVTETRKDKQTRKATLRKEERDNKKTDKEKEKKRTRRAERPRAHEDLALVDQAAKKDAIRPRKEHSSNVTAPIKSSVSWLISFPNSGTTYTIHNTEQVSMRSTATNYAMELHYKADMVPIRPNKDNFVHGPWQRNNTLPMPPLALTKTHCAGYGDRAPLQNSIVSTERFLNGCTESSQYRDPNNRSSHAKRKSNYKHEGLVESVIHLIRNPFDNVISRMHHGMKMRQKRLGFSADQIRTFMESPKGVMSWCKISDRAFWREREVPKKITNKNKLKRIPFDANLLLKVPCHSEFFRYMEWHNAALRMIEQEKFPSLVIYYEDYETNYNQTVDSILDFLNLSREAPPLPFKTGKTYRDLFFPEETQQATRRLLKAMASKELWSILKRYFPSTPSNTTSAIKV